MRVVCIARRAYYESVCQLSERKVIVMRTIFYRTFFAGLALLALATVAAAQTRPNVREAALNIALAQPATLKTGENQFEVTVKGADGHPINDAIVSVVLTTSRLPARGWLWKEVKLTPSGNGMYVGAGTLPNAPKWETTIKVKKDGKKIGQRKVTLATS